MHQNATPDPPDLDMGEDIGKLLENKDTVVARMLPPDYTSFNVVLGDLTKEVGSMGCRWRA